MLDYRYRLKCGKGNTTAKRFRTLKLYQIRRATFLAYYYPELTPDRTAVEAFVTRFYELFFDRQPDNKGLYSWMAGLLNGSSTGADIAIGFVFSPEFVERNTNNQEYLRILYRAFFNRDPDQDGWKYWLSQLESGVTREFLNGFIYSTEFVELCDEFGIKAFEHHITKSKREAVEAFVARFYQLCLNRDPDVAGLETWTNNLLNQIQTGADVAYSFVFSQEFIDQGTTNEQYIDVLYRAFFDREPDDDGYIGWLNLLNSGVNRLTILNGFTGSQEFFNLCKRFGITPN